MKGPLLLLQPAADLLPSFNLQAHVPPPAAHLFPLANTEPSSLLLQCHRMSDTAGSQMVSRGGPAELCSAAG